MKTSENAKGSDIFRGFLISRPWISLILADGGFMKIGIVIAIERELKAFLESEYKIEELQNRSTKYFRTAVGENEVYAIKSGYGLIDAAAATQFLISCCGVEVILNFGVTGALDPVLKVEDLLLVTKCMNYDYDVSPIDPVKRRQYEEFADEFIPLDVEMAGFARKLLPELKDAVCCSGDRFIEERQDKTERFNAGCSICDMELAAIARTCALQGVKCLSVKCISDTFAGDGGDFNTNVSRSAAKAFGLIDRLLNEL